MKTKLSIKETLFRPENVKLITDWLAANKQKNRTNLATYVCEKLGFRDAKGRLRLSTTLKALRDLEVKGYWKLPESAMKKPGGWNPRRLDHAVAMPQSVPSQVEGIEGLELVEVRTDDDARLRIWNELMLSEHPLKDCRLVGRQLRYLIDSPHGWLGGIGFGSSALYLESRDKWIGWDEAQRTEYNPCIINMTRFLIRESAECKNLASHVLGVCARRVAADFEIRYGYRPWLMESFVDRDLYDGICYQAANWICVGQTKGQGRNGTKKAGKSIKDVYMYPLVSNFRSRMDVRKTDERSALSVDSGLESGQWARQEFGGSDLGDKRLTDQLVKMAENKGKQPGASYAGASQGNRHALKGYYRLINNEREQMSAHAILDGHREQTICRMKNEKTALVIQDTMDLNFATRLHCEGLGPIGKNQMGTESKGLKMHSALALNTKGLPLGVLRVETYAPKANGKKTNRNNIPIEKKESYRWVKTYQDVVTIAEEIPETHVVCVGDRESDIFELFDQRRKRSGRVDILVRAQHNRCLDEQEKKLFEQLANGEADAETCIAVPRQREKKGKPSKSGRKSLPARTARVELRFQHITILPPRTVPLKNKKPIQMFAIHLSEKNAPPDAKPIKWMLLTTIEVRSVKQAMKCVRWYCLRWRIEEWHRVLKSGCRILEHQNHSAESLARTIAIDVVIGWRIMLLALLGREAPDMPCSLLFDSWECEVLQVLAQKKSLCRSVRQL